MFSFFKSQELKDFQRAMDFLECSRTLMGSAIETHRQIEEANIDDIAEILLLGTIVKPSDSFLKRNLADTMNRFMQWRQALIDAEDGRLHKVRRIVSNTEKNLEIAMEKSMHIDRWIREDMSVVEMLVQSASSSSSD
jgi:hypothetical protein